MAANGAHTAPKRGLLAAGLLTLLSLTVIQQWADLFRLKPSVGTRQRSFSLDRARFPQQGSYAASWAHRNRHARLKAREAGHLMDTHPVIRARFSANTLRARRSMRISAVESEVGAPPRVEDDRSALQEDPERIRRGRLPCGLRYTVIRNPKPRNKYEVHLQLPVGSVAEGDGENGMAHLMEHVTFVGNPHRRGVLASGTVSSNALTDFHHTVYFADSRNQKELEPVLLGLVQVAFRAIIADEVVEKEKDAILSEASMLNSMEYRIMQEELSELHKETVMPKRLPLGTMDIIKKLTVEQATKFYRKHYKPANAHLYIIGDLDLEKAVESVENMLHNFTPPERTLDEETFPRAGMRPLYNHIYTSDRTQLPLKKPKVVEMPMKTGLTASLATKEPIPSLGSLYDIKEDLLTKLAHRIIIRRLGKAFTNPEASVEFEILDREAEDCRTVQFNVRAQTTKELNKMFYLGVMELKGLYEQGGTMDEVQFMKEVTESHSKTTLKHGVDTMDEVSLVMVGDLYGYPNIGFRGLASNNLRLLPGVTQKDINRKIQELLKPFCRYGEQETGQLALFMVTTPPQSELQDPVDPNLLCEILQTEYVDQHLTSTQEDTENPDVSHSIAQRQFPTEEDIDSEVEKLRPEFVPLENGEMKFRDPLSGVVCRRLSNGIRINYKRIDEGELDGRDVTVSAVSPGGLYQESLQKPCAIRLGAQAMCGKDCTYGGVHRDVFEDVTLREGLNFSMAMESEELVVQVEGDRDNLGAIFKVLRMPYLGFGVTQKTVDEVKRDMDQQYKLMVKEVDFVAMDEICGAVSKWDPRVVLPRYYTLKNLRSQDIQYNMNQLLAPGNLEVNVVGVFDDEEIERTILKYLGTVPHRHIEKEVVDPSFRHIWPDTSRTNLRAHIADDTERAAVVIGQLGPSMFGSTIGTRNPFSSKNGVWIAGSDAEFSEGLEDDLMVWKRSHPLYVPVATQVIQLLVASEMHFSLRDSLGLAYAATFELTRNIRHTSGLWTLEVATTPQAVDEVVAFSSTKLSKMNFDEMELLQAKTYLLQEHYQNLKSPHYWAKLMAGLQQDGTANKDFRSINDYEKIVRTLTISDLYDVWGSFNTDPSEVIRSVCTSGSIDCRSGMVNDDRDI
ncbi:hypothetical protein AAMO2058_000543900 [Amorphochlora amoebiformis]